MHQHPSFVGELDRLRTRAPREADALRNAIDKLAAEGPQLRHPNSSAVMGGAAGLRELRPREGRAPWRGLYVRTNMGFVVLALAPEAIRDRRGFTAAVSRAGQRLREVNSDDR